MHKLRYELKQFHFHRPSEEKIAGKGYEMTGHHLAHADEKGNVALLAIPSREGEGDALVHIMEGPAQGKIESEKDLQINQMRAA
jgi:carbonic anhydrase